VAARVLVVDDDPSVCRLLQVGLARRGFEVVLATSSADALRVLETAEIDVVLTDVLMEGTDGLQLCARISAERPDVPVIVMTASQDLGTAVGAIRAGAYDFVTKPVEFELFVVALERAVRHRGLTAEVERLRRAVEEAGGFGDLVGTSAPMRKVYDLLSRIADSDASVLICGESGTGKELAARALHRQGPRSAGPFVAVSCSAIPEGLLESELFGHVRGAFTDARFTRAGLFVQASGGTLFLDEIGDLPLGLQPKLLRALQERVVRPVGGEAEVPFDVRLIAATNRDLRRAVEKHEFREDLFFRLAVIQIELPPLRARGNDVLALAHHFIARFTEQAGKRVRCCSQAAAERLLAYPWPGNVRELQNAMERAVALTRRDEVGIEDLPDSVRGFRGRPRTRGDGSEDLMPLAEIERRHILQVLDAVGNDRTRAARVLGVDRKTLYRKLARYKGGDGRRRSAN
jgi:DNA-binding NtrC family response regulator